MSNNTISNKSKRLRKKLYLDEFAVLGFEVKFKLSSENDDLFEGIFNEMISFLESQNLIMNIAVDGEQFHLYVSSHARYESATDENRAATEAFLNEQKGLEEINVAPLSDAYYGN